MLLIVQEYVEQLNPPIPPLLGLAKNWQYSENGSVGSHVQPRKSLFAYLGFEN